MDQVKFVDQVKSALSRPYHFKFFKGCLPKNLLSPLLNTLYDMFTEKWNVNEREMRSALRIKDCRQILLTILTLSWITLQNGQTYFKNLAVFTPLQF